MPKSRVRKKYKPKPPPRRDGWWKRNRDAVYNGIGGGIFAGCLPVFAAIIVFPIVLVIHYGQI